MNTFPILSEVLTGQDACKKKKKKKNYMNDSSNKGKKKTKKVKGDESKGY